MKKLLYSLFDYLARSEPRNLQVPLVRAESEAKISMSTAPNGYSKTFPLFIGQKSKQPDIPEEFQESFVIETHFSALIVASTSCTNDNCSPVYQIRNRKLVRSNVDFQPSASVGNEASYTGSVVKDQVCLKEDELCAEVNFLAMGDDWRYYNMLGIAPRTETTGPLLIQKL